MFENLKTIPLEEFDKNVRLLQANEGIQIVALPVEDYNLILDRLLREHTQCHYDPSNHGPNQGWWFTYQGIAFTRMEQIPFGWIPPGEEVTDSSDFHQEEWNPDWNSGPGGVAYHVDIRI